MRALEVSRVSGLTMSEWRQRHGFREQRYDVCKIGLVRDRQDLYERIERRVDRMLEAGWVKEVEDLLGRYPRSAKAFQGIGYREIALYLEGGITYADMAARIKKATRRYAKRQITWFSREEGVFWHRYPEEGGAILERVEGFLA